MIPLRNRERQPPQRIDRELFRSDRLLAHRLDANQLVRRHQSPFQASCDCALGGGHHRQLVCPTIVVIKFLRGGEILHLVCFGRERDLAQLLHGASVSGISHIFYRDERTGHNVLFTPAGLPEPVRARLEGSE